MTDADLQSILASLAPPRSGGGSRGPVLDKELIKENITNSWRFYLMDEPPNSNALADQYIAEHLAFARQGGSLDLSTWTLGKVRGTARYGTMYRRKPAEMSEADFINQYRGTADDFGLPTSITTQNIRSGMTSGASVAGFQKRIEYSRPVQARGGFGRKVANVVAQLGVLNR